MIDHKKISLIQVAKQRLGLEEEEYRLVLKRLAGVDSSKDLDEDGFRVVMLYFERCGFVSTAKKRNFGDRAGMATASQVALIRALWSEFTAGAGTDATLGKWLGRTFKVSSIRFVNAETARKTICALKAMVEKKTASAVNSMTTTA